jgi:hypothetical protein
MGERRQQGSPPGDAGPSHDTSRGLSTGSKLLDGFGSQRLAADAPFAAGYFRDLHRGHTAHVLALDRDHGVNF